jgi:hypothetical protein
MSIVRWELVIAAVLLNGVTNLACIAKRDGKRNTRNGIGIGIG